MGQEFSRASQVRRAAIYSVGIAGGVGLALIAIFGLFDDALAKRMYRNCLAGHPDRPFLCLTEESALGLEFYVP